MTAVVNKTGSQHFHVGEEYEMIKKWRSVQQRHTAEGNKRRRTQTRERENE